MKKRALICCLAPIFLFAGSLKAQQSSAILKAGVNFANVTVSDDGDIDEAKVLTSFQIGVIGDLNVAPFLAIQPGLIVTGKGTKSQSGTEGSANWYRATTNPFYLEVPLNVVFKTTPGPVRFYGGAGPYLAMGIAGKNKTNGSFIGADFSSEENIQWSDDDPTTLNNEEGAGFGIMKRFDYGLNFLAGIETRNMIFGANYGLGLAKLQSGSNSGSDANNKHRVFSIVIGFKL